MNSWVHGLSFPLSVVLAACLVLVIMLLHRFCRRNSIVVWLSGDVCLRWQLCLGALLLAIEGTWSVPVHTSAAFAVYLAVMLVSLGLQIFRGAVGTPWLCRVGVWLIVAGSLLGAPDRMSCKMQIYTGEAGSIAYTGDGEAVTLPFTVALDRFETEYYASDPAAPRQFRSYLLVDGRKMVTEVNSPAAYKGYDIFQEGCDMDGGRYSVLLFVRDPWLPVTYIGMALLAVAAVLLSLGRWNLKVMLPVVLVISLVFTALSVAKINFQTLAPALRSWWFVPHLGMYMIAYSLVAVAVAVVAWNMSGYGRTEPACRDSGLAAQLMQSASGLIVLGMLMGSVWARQAWGDYWGWDPKENWAAVTWIMTLSCLPAGQAALHTGDCGRWRQAVYILLTFISLQITWYGVNYLPSAVDSMHTYNR